MAKDTEEAKEIKWKIPEYNKHKRTKLWYFNAIIVAIALLVFSFLTANFLFALIIVITGVIVILNDGRDPQKVKIVIDGEGIYIGKRFYDYDEFRNFSMVYKPKRDIKNIYFEYKNKTKQRISIPLMDNNPLIVRDFLLRYLDEDLDRTDEPLSEALARFLKL